MDAYRLDSHKMMYHPRAVAEWLENANAGPIYAEVGLTARCNHRCVFCSFQYVDRKGPDIGTYPLIYALAAAQERGLKSVLFAGEGEPLLHPDVVRIVDVARERGLDVGIYTNGSALTPALADKLLPNLTFLRFSLDAASAESHAAIHGVSAKEYPSILEHITYAVEHKGNCTIGVQAIALPENLSQLKALGLWCHENGADYFSVKPFTAHPKSGGKHFVPDARKLEETRQDVTADVPDVIWRESAFEHVDGPIPYPSCLALDFWTYIDATGDVYACSAFLGDRSKVYGNIYMRPFGEIWDNRKEVQARIYDVSQCRRACRMDSVNRYLWMLKNPPAHPNFI